MKIGFIGLGNVGAKLAGTIARNGYQLVVHDLNRAAAQGLLEGGASRGVSWGESPAEIARACDYIITCLPSPVASAAVMEGPDGLLQGLGPGKIWAEMSTTDAGELRRLAALVEAKGAAAIDCPVSGGCHRAASGNISIFAGCTRETFERALPVLTTLGQAVLHTGEIGSASLLKVMTNYLATTYEAIRISSGNSFVHETESQVILNGSRDINFTMDLVLKDIGLFDRIAQDQGVPLALSPLLVSLFEEAVAEYGPRERSPNIIKRYEAPTGLDIRAPGFPAEIVDDKPEAQGYEVRPKRGAPEGGAL